MTKPLTNLILASVCASAIFAFAPMANANLIDNGSFELGTPDSPLPAFQTVPDGDSATIADWTVGPGTVDWIHSYWPAAPDGGTKSVDLSGTSQGTISQVINGLNNGQTYILSFYLATNEDRPPLQPMMWSIGSHTGTADAISDPNVSWFQYFFEFLWNEGSTGTLLFATTTTHPGVPGCESGLCFGPAIDAAVLEAVPLPAALPLLLAGLGAVGFLGRRRKRKAALAA